MATAVNDPPVAVLIVTVCVPLFELVTTPVTSSKKSNWPVASVFDKEGKAAEVRTLVAVKLTPVTAWLVFTVIAFWRLKTRASPVFWPAVRVMVVGTAGVDTAPENFATLPLAQP